MAMGFKDLVISFLIIGLFMFSLLSLGMQFAADNNAAVSITDNKIINQSFRGIEAELNTSQGRYSSELDKSENQSLKEGSDNLLITSISQTRVVARSTIVLVFNVLATMFKTILDINPIVTGTFFSILLIIIIFGVYRLIRSGE